MATITARKNESFNRKSGVENEITSEMDLRQKVKAIYDTIEEKYKDALTHGIHHADYLSVKEANTLTELDKVGKELYMEQAECDDATTINDLEVALWLTRIKWDALKRLEELGVC